MSYDITFCEGTNCRRKEQCHRYRELLQDIPQTEQQENQPQILKT